MSTPRRPSPETVAVLEALLERGDAWSHGYELAKGCALPSGTLYPILSRLAERGWIEGRWLDPVVAGRPPRHAYRLTGEGRREAAAAVRGAVAAAGRIERAPRIAGETA